MAQIDVPSFEQIATILSQLATNYSNLFADYYNLFYNPTPMDIKVELYDDEGNLNEITIPNRAKDKTYILNGSGNPEGSVSAPMGSTYQDIAGGVVYVKQFDTTDSTGWSELMTLGSLGDFLIQDAGTPEGSITASKGVLYVDKASASLYIKNTDSGNTGWVLLSTDMSNLANKDLNNLTITTQDGVGINRFANTSLSNLNTDGQSVLSSKEDKSNKITTISVSSTDVQYPSAKATYNFVTEASSLQADVDLSNLTSAGEGHFVKVATQVRDCILSAPNGLPSISGNIVNLAQGTVLLCANGATNSVVTVGSAKSVTISGSVADEGLLLYNNTNDALLYCSLKKYYRQISQPTGSTNSIWYNPSNNEYRVMSLGNWSKIVAAEIGRYSQDNSGNVSNFYSYSTLKTATEDDISVLQNQILRIGDPIPTLNFDYLPVNCIWLEGSEISKVSYPHLYSIYGDNYGTPLDNDNFVLPDLRGKVFWGEETQLESGVVVPYIDAGLPNLTGWFQGSGTGTGNADGQLFKVKELGIDVYNTGGEPDNRYTFDASSYNSIYGNSSTVQPPAIKVRYYTRYQ